MQTRQILGLGFYTVQNVLLHIFDQVHETIET